jgi:hypothetical protein
VGEQFQQDYFQYDFSPFGKRDFVISALLYQNPETKQVVVNVAADPDKAPPQAGYFRVTNLNNKWRISPLENGQVEIEIENNMDPGGFMPTLMYNTGRPKGIHYVLTHLESWVGKDKYQNAKFAFIKDKNSSQATDVSQTYPAP